MGYVLVTPPTTEPLSLDDVKAHLRIDADDEDALISALVAASRQHFERRTGRSLIDTVWRLVLDRFPPGGGPIRLGNGPVSAVSSVGYIDSAGVSRVLAEETGYLADLSGDIGKLSPVFWQPWPCDAAHRPGGVTVQYTAGFGPTADAVPQLVKQALLLLIGHWYENRETVVIPDRTVTITDVPLAFDAVADSYQIPLLA